MTVSSDMLGFSSTPERLATRERVSGLDTRRPLELEAAT
jgi:hypothetical protein